MEKQPQIPATYDRLFLTGGDGGVFDLPYRRSGYYPLFQAVGAALRLAGARQVLEVGCGTGALAHMLFDTFPVSYRGFDFSPVAVEKARRRTGRHSEFFLGDATAHATYAGLQYDALVCTEVLEHIEDDLLAVSHWAPGTFCVCSVPNYDAPDHVRHFRTSDEVVDRYGALLDIQRVVTRRKPLLNDRTFGKWLQAVRWNRYRPDQLRCLLGFADFDRDGGWFIFSGRRRAS